MMVILKHLRPSFLVQTNTQLASNCSASLGARILGDEVQVSPSASIQKQRRRAHSEVEQSPTFNVLLPPIGVAVSLANQWWGDEVV